jgi:DNA-binding transcriptional regulator WhiA
MVTRQDCIKGLRQAAKEIGHSPSRPEYQSLNIGPSVNSLKKYLGGSWNSAKEQAGLSTKGVGGSLDLNENYFSQIETTEKAYWLGMLYGDGSLCEPEKGNAQLSLGLQERKHVQAFLDVLDAEHSITESEKSRNNMFSIGIRNTNLTEDLRSHGLGPNKTHSGSLPELTKDELRAAFVRGLFDADGHVGQNRRFNITGASQERFSILLDWIPVQGSIVDRGDGAFTFRVGSSEKVDRLYGWLYPEGVETEPKLNRKYKDAK